MIIIVIVILLLVNDMFLFPFEFFFLLLLLFLIYRALSKEQMEAMAARLERMKADDEEEQFSRNTKERFLRLAQKLKDTATNTKSTTATSVRILG